MRNVFDCRESRLLAQFEKLERAPKETNTKDKLAEMRQQMPDVLKEQERKEKDDKKPEQKTEKERLANAEKAINEFQKDNKVLSPKATLTADGSTVVNDKEFSGLRLNNRAFVWGNEELPKQREKEVTIDFDFQWGADARDKGNDYPDHPLLALYTDRKVAQKRSWELESGIKIRFLPLKNGHRVSVNTKQEGEDEKEIATADLKDTPIDSAGWHRIRMSQKNGKIRVYLIHDVDNTKTDKDFRELFEIDVPSEPVGHSWGISHREATGVPHTMLIKSMKFTQ